MPGRPPKKPPKSAAATEARWPKRKEPDEEDTLAEVRLLARHGSLISLDSHPVAIPLSAALFAAQSIAESSRPRQLEPELRDEQVRRIRTCRPPLCPRSSAMRPQATRLDPSTAESMESGTDLEETPHDQVRLLHQVHQFGR